MTESTRLYHSFQPEHYDIYLDINRETKTIVGKTTITGNASEETIALHQKFFTIETVTVNGTAVDFTVDAKAELVRFGVGTTGAITVQVSYHAELTDTMMGIYPSYYTVDGVQKQLIGTQFETTAARQAFPGVDEPAAKATFSLAIKYDEHEGETIIANMPEIKVENGVHYFDKTVKMSTYLVAFAFGDMQKKVTKTKSGVTVGIFATKAHPAKNLDFGLDIAKRSIEFYEDFYHTPYPLPHSWQLALPDFSAGAMENWGLITYREAYLVVDPDNVSLPVKQSVATVIAHEVAHQWFGDLVTMQWWDDLWLNESFANMMEYVAIDAIEPSWNVWDSFQTGDVAAALRRDATDGVQSVHVQVEDPAEIDSIFDGAIVYAKGARMLVMVRSLIGDDALRSGLKAYFDAHQYGNAAGDDLWDALGKASGMDLKAIMHSWLEQPGYPVVSVSVVDGKLKLSQKQFFIGEGKDAGRLWQLPLASNVPGAPTLMTDATLDLGDYAKLREEAGAPLRINLGNNAHFIVNYDRSLLDDILAHVGQLDAISQLQLLQDLRLLAEGRVISYADVVPLLSHFADSTEAVVVTALYQLMSALRLFVTPDSPEEAQLKALFGQLSTAPLKQVGWVAEEGESNDFSLSRPWLISAALYAEDKAAILAAHELFEGHASDLSRLPAAIRSLVLANEVKHFSKPGLQDQLLDLYRTSSDATFKADLRTAIVAGKDQADLEAVVALFEQPTTVKPQDLRGWFAGVLANPAGEQLAWDWLRNDWAWLEATVGGDMEFTTYITVASRAFKTAARLAEFKAFFTPKLDQPGLGREITMDTNVIASRVALIEAEQAAVNAAVTAAVNG